VDTEQLVQGKEALFIGNSPLIAGQLSPKQLAEVERDTLKNHPVWALGVVF
jgi:hypothetical protein